MFKNVSKNKLLVVLVIVFAIILVAVLFKDKIIKNDGYSVVYLVTGEIYAGKLTTFPSLKLKDGYILQVTKDTTDPTKSNFQLAPFKDTLWASPEIHLIKKNVIFYGKLSSDSKISQTLAEQVK